MKVKCNIFVSFCCLFDCFFVCFGLMDRAHFDFGNVNTDFDGHDEDCNYSTSVFLNIPILLKLQSSPIN